MKKSYQVIIIALVGALFFYFPSLALAHTQIEESFPTDGEVVTTEFSEITLTFNTSIEALSSFKLFDQNNQEVPLNDIILETNRMERHITDGTDLKNGEYTVEWKIVGKDGHPIEGEYNFTVDLPEEQTASSSESELTENFDTTETTENIETKPNTEEIPSIQALPSEESNSNTWYYVGAGIILIIVMAALMRQRKRRKQ
ncbi:copper resistance protein CopC [Paenibacillus provencensis]|uniref:Copper resistance protein CopC n=1 Tax=Paenibacillus provencensis TaxID=441151 RepID=A0ABW3PZ03_9BACL